MIRNHFYGVSVYSFYLLDQFNRILDAGGDWDVAASQADRPDLHATNIVGTSIWEFTKSTEVRAYLNAIFFAARSKQDRIKVKYRCDAPGLVRWFNMHVIPERSNGLTVEHALDDQINCNATETFIDALGGEKAVCTFCNAHLTEQGWHPTEHAFFWSGEKARCALCPSCKTEILSAAR